MGLKLINFIELIGGVLLLKPVLDIFKIDISQETIKILIIFVISYGIIEALKNSRKMLDNLISNKIEEKLEEKLKNGKKEIKKKKK